MWFPHNAMRLSMRLMCASEKREASVLVERYCGFAEHPAMNDAREESKSARANFLGLSEWWTDEARRIKGH